MKMMIEIAAAYSDSPMRMYLWNTGQLFALASVTATRKVPTQPITEYRNEAREVFRCARPSSCILL